MAKSNVRFRMVAVLDAANGRPQECWVVVNRETGVVVIRGLRRRKFWLSMLQEMQREVGRQIQAEWAEKRKARRRGRR